MVESGEQCEKPNTNPPSNPSSTCPSDTYVCLGSNRCGGSEGDSRYLRDYYCGSNCLCSYNDIFDINCRCDATDSDNGIDYLNQGTCTDYSGCSGGSCQSSSYTDYCLDSTRVREYYVSGSGDAAACSYIDYDCNNYDGWYNVGSPYACCKPGTEETCTCQDQEYRDYYCSGGNCVYSIKSRRTIYTSCTDCNSYEATYPCRDYYCSNGQCNYNLRPCGYPCPNGRCTGGGTVECYSYLGAQTNCPYLNCNVPPLPNEPSTDYWKRVWVDSNCGRSGLYAINPSDNTDPNSLCKLNSCDLTPTYTSISASWSSIEYPSPTYTYKVGDIIEIKVKGITATSGFTPLLECRLKKFNRTNHFVGGIEFDSWVKGPFPKDITFSYKIKPNCEFCEKYHGATCSQCSGGTLQGKACWSCTGGDSIAQQYCSEGCDPSGYWIIDYCILATDFSANRGWILKGDWADRSYCVSTLVVTG